MNIFTNHCTWIISCIGLCIGIIVYTQVHTIKKQELDTAKQNVVKADINAWSGILNVTGIPVPVILYIHQNSSKKTEVILNCMELGINDQSATYIELPNGSVKFEIEASNISYEGCIDKNTSEITGIFHYQDLFSQIIVFKKGLTTYNRPQEPIAPYPYHQEEVSYENVCDGVTLVGTFTRPHTTKKVPAVILIAGSGPINRDEEVFKHKPFLVLADRLTQSGIAVLRVDKRGIGSSTGSYKNATTADFASDVLAGIDYLKTREEIDSRQIGLIGHSEGGIIAPIVASQSNDVAFIILMGAPAIHFKDVLLEQVVLKAKVVGQSDAMTTFFCQYQNKILDIIEQEPNVETASNTLHEYATQFFDAMPESHKNEYNRIYGSPLSLVVIEGLAKSFNTLWIRYLLNYDPAATLQLVSVPVFALNGSLDLQVSSTSNLKVIKEALAKNTDVTIIEYPNMNHLFQTCNTGAFSEYLMSEETISPIVLNALTSWIISKTLGNHND